MYDSEEIAIEDFFELSKSGGTYEIDTPDGWVELGDLVIKEGKECYCLRLENGAFLEASDDHRVMTVSGWRSVGEVEVGRDVVCTEDGDFKVVAREFIGVRDTFDLEVRHENQRYYSNGIVSHNTGKTVFVRAIGQALNMPIFMFDVASMTNSDFVEAWVEAMDWSPSIVLIEDIHSSYDGPKRITDTGKEPGLTFDCLLNVLDGVENTDGIVTVITSNDIAKVDSALGGRHGLKEGEDAHTRPGRVDRVIQFDILDEAGRQKMAHRILDEFEDKRVEEVVSSGDGMTGAEFQDLCRRVAQGLNGF